MQYSNYFFALWPSPDLALRLYQQTVGLFLNKGLDINKIKPPSKLHITLLYVGKMSEDQYRQILPALNLLSFNSFTLDLSKINFWEKSHVIWLGCDYMPQELRTLVKQLNEIVERIGFKLNKRAFIPHMTLARYPMSSNLKQRVSNISWKVDRFYLLKSTPMRGNVFYEKIASFSGANN